MKKDHWLRRLGALLLVSYTLLAVVAAAGTPGTESDPLVTLSYLNGTFRDQMLDEVDEMLEMRDQALPDKLAERLRQDPNAQQTQGGGTTGAAVPASESFSVVTLTGGQTLYGQIGCEVMLRVGTASCVTDSSPGLIDETDGSVLGGGAALVRNHLYMMTIDGRGVNAGAETVKLMVRGGYTVR